MKITTSTRKLGDKTRTVAMLRDGHIVASVVVDGDDKVAALDQLVETLRTALNRAVDALAEAEQLALTAPHQEAA